MADGSFKANEWVELSAFPEDSANQPAPVVAGSYAWQSEPSGLVTLTPTGDGSTCQARGVAAGTVLVTCAAQNAAGAVVSGVVELEVTEVPAPLADHIRLVIGPAQPQ